MTDVVPVQQDLGRLPDDDPFRRAYQRKAAECRAIAVSPLAPDVYRLDRNRQPRHVDDITRDIMVVRLDAEARGLTWSLTTLTKYAIVNGAAFPMGQLLIGLVARHGHDLWIEERSEEQATVVLLNARTGREHRVTYTLEEAKKTSSYKKNTNLGPDKSVWLSHPADMLVWRAVNRAVRIGAPDIAAGFGLPDEMLPPAPVAAALPPERPAIEASVEVMGERPNLEPYGPVPPEAAQRAKDTGRRVLRIRNQVAAMPEHVRTELGRRWGADALPRIELLTEDHLDTAEDLIDAVTAWALEVRPVADEVSHAHSRQRDEGRRDRAGTPVVPSAPREGADGQAEGTPDARYPAPNPDAAPARPLAQQIAMQAQAAGIDHHHVIAAVTAGDKTSAKDVDAEEGQLVLQAIASIKAGEYSLGQGHDGTWRFVNPPAAQQTFDPSDPGRPFTDD